MTRWMFKHTVFHFHASGISTLYPSLNKLEKMLFHWAYNKPSVGIRTSPLNPDDATFLRARNNIVIENGLPDVFARFEPLVVARKTHAIPRILFVGALYETKGIGVLINAARILKERKVEFELECVGRFESLVYESEIKARVADSGLDQRISFPGVLTGDDKWAAYARADIFSFPTYFESESFGLVNIEAMQFELPVVSTRWRGIPGVIKDGENGSLVDIRNPQQLADQLISLLADSALRERMGRVGRAIYLERFSATVWGEKMGHVLRDIF